MAYPVLAMQGQAAAGPEHNRLQRRLMKLPRLPCAAYFRNGGPADCLLRCSRDCGVDVGLAHSF